MSAACPSIKYARRFRDFDGLPAEVRGQKLTWVDIPEKSLDKRFHLLGRELTKAHRRFNPDLLPPETRQIHSFSTERMATPPPEQWYALPDLLRAFPHLRLRSGFTVDYAYYYTQHGGFPIPYSRRIEERRLSDEELSKSPSSLLEAFDVDHDADAFVDLMLIHMYANQINLYWHGMYRLRYILCSIGDFACQFRAFEPPNTFPHPETKIEPLVALTQDGAIVRSTFFGPWYGLQRVWHKFSMYPLRVEVTSIEIAEYDIGILL